MVAVWYGMLLKASGTGSGRRQDQQFRASVRLNVSLRTVQRKMKEYRERGEECFEHGNRSPRPTKVDLDAIIAFIEEHDLSGCNFTELSGLLDECLEATLIFVPLLGKWGQHLLSSDLALRY